MSWEMAPLLKRLSGTGCLKLQYHGVQKHFVLAQKWLCLTPTGAATGRTHLKAQWQKPVLCELSFPSQYRRVFSFPCAQGKAVVSFKHSLEKSLGTKCHT